VDVVERRRLLLLLAPYVAGLALLVAGPALVTVGLSLFEYDLVTSARWVGLDNFRELFHDDVFRIALGNSLIFAAFAVPLRLLGALGLALLLHRRARGAGAARAAVVLPSVVPEIAYGLLWLWLFNPLYGPINILLRTGGDGGFTVFGRTPPQWLTDPSDARAAIVVMSLFVIGESFILLLAARQGLPDELYELSAIEDATWWDVFRRVTLPLLAPLLLLLFLRDTILSFQWNFVPALIVTEGGPPPYATTFVPLFVYREGFEYLRYGYAAAATVVMLVLTGIVVLLQWRILRRWQRRESSALELVSE
jgi:multiple sugar transport system permease protein